MSQLQVVREHGICRGNLYTQRDSASKVYEYCTLIGNIFATFSSYTNYLSGHHPVSEVRIVGASAWNPKVSPARSFLRSAIQTPAQKSKSASKDTSIRIVTFGGTHILCWANSVEDKEIWLAALHSGLEASFKANEQSSTLNSKNRDYPKDGHQRQDSITLSVDVPNFSYQMPLAPVPRQTPLIGNTTDLSLFPHCISCGKIPEADTTISNSVSSNLSNGVVKLHPNSSPLPQYGIEEVTDLCGDCLTAQGLLRNVVNLCGLYASHAHEEAALETAQKACKMVVEHCQKGEKASEQVITDLSVGASLDDLKLDESDQDSPLTTNSGLGESWENIASAESSSSNDEDEHLNVGRISPNSDDWAHVSPADPKTRAVLSLVRSARFSTLRRRSRLLEVECRRLEGGLADVGEFVELIGGGNELLKPSKEAFKMAGDMSAAVKILHDHALTKRDQSIEMLTCILDFFLELIEEGDLGAVAFFWPQIRLIHLRMLPAKNSDELIRIELVEDFLLTVCTKHCIHLGLELIWGLLADLEEAFDESESSPKHEARRFGVMRFICELESILFNFDGCWGGGSVTLRGFLSPSQHQARLLRDAVASLQCHRRKSPHKLCRSARMSHLLNEASGGEHDVTEREAQSALFFRDQMYFAHRIGDIAEKLRHMEVESRASALKAELDVLNDTRLGGSPFSRAGEKIVPMLRIPSDEGHVFRSKERTPVLLLFEVQHSHSHIEAKGKAEEEEISNELPVTIHVAHEMKQTATGESTLEDLPNEVNVVAASSDSTEKDVYKSPSMIDQKDCQNEKNEANNDSTEGRNCDKEEDKLYSSDESVAHSAKDDRITADDSNIGNGTQEYCSDNNRFVDSDVKSITVVDEGNMDDNSDSALSEQEDTFNITSLSASHPIPTTKHATLSSPLGRSVTALRRFDVEDTLKLPDLTSPKSSTVEDLLQDATHGLPLSEVLGQRVTSVEELNNITINACEYESKDDPDKPVPASRKISPFTSNEKQLLLDTYGDGRREVLTTIVEKGKRGNSVAKATTNAVQKAVQVMDEKRASSVTESNSSSKEDSIVNTNTSEDDETMETLRILLLQNQTAITYADSVVHSNNDTSLEDRVLNQDAGVLDPRLAGCGPLSPALHSAFKLWKDKTISSVELLELVKKDQTFLQQTSVATEASLDERKENSAFWVRFAFGERWVEKKARIAASSAHGAKDGWDLMSLIVKSNDDLRQEAFVMQLIELSQEAFETAGLELWLHPYRIIATSRRTGIIETIKDALSFDALKKRPGYSNGGLKGHFEKMTQCATNPKQAFEAAQRNFARSLAAYSLLSYFFMMKDRHNGNLLMDTAGHVIHIDFGFVFGIAPGGSFSLEASTPFKITDEMVEVLGGRQSPIFSEFVTLFCCGFLALQAHADTFMAVIGITCQDSDLPCFVGKEVDDVLEMIRKRFVTHLDGAGTVVYALDLIKDSMNSYGTSQYDYYQLMSQGIAY